MADALYNPYPNQMAAGVQADRRIDSGSPPVEKEMEMIMQTPSDKPSASASK